MTENLKNENIKEVKEVKEVKNEINYIEKIKELENEKLKLRFLKLQKEVELLKNQNISKEELNQNFIKENDLTTEENDEKIKEESNKYIDKFIDENK